MADVNYFRNEDVDIHIIITNESATVTGVVDDVPTISGATYIVTDEELVTEQFELKESLCSQNRPVIGTCESAQLKFDMIIHDDEGNDFIIPSRDDVIKVYMWFDEDSSNIMTIGTYKVKTVNLKVDENKAMITAYDLMLTFRNTDVSDWFYQFWKENEIATIKQFTDELLDHLGMKRYGALVNQSVFIEQFINDADVISAGYLLSLICEANGAFGHITRDNKFGVIRISSAQTNATTIDEDARFNPTRRSKYEYTWAPTGVKLLDANGNKIAGYRATKEKPYIIKNNPLLESVAEDDRKGALKNIYKAMELWGYAPAKVKCIGDLTVEVGDRIRVNEEAEDGDADDGYFKTFVLERTYKGIYVPYDTYEAKGDTDLTQTSSVSVTNNFSGGSLENNASVNSSNTGKYNIVNSGLAYEDLPEIIRNFGLRLLDEPSNVNILTVGNSVALRWNDPSDLEDDSPCPCEWAGTVVVRKLGKAPINRWDGEVILDSTIRNQYADDSFIDNADVDKDYYYGIFPYDTEGHYRYTKSVGINTDYKGEYPSIDEIEADDSANVTVGFSLPSGNWKSIKLCYKKDAIPDITDASVVLNASDRNKIVKVDNDGGQYYFIIYMIDSNDRVIESNEQDIFVEKVTNYYLLDAENGIASQTITDFASYTDYSANYYFDSNRVLTVSRNGGHSMYSTKQGFMKGRATKMYVDIEGIDALHDSQLHIMLGKQQYTSAQPWGTPSWSAFTCVNYGQYYTNYPRQTVSISLDNIGENDLFYIGFHKADITPKIRKIYFDDEISYTKGIFNCYGVDVDTHIARANSYFSGSKSYEGNNMVFSEDANGKYWGNSDLRYTNCYQSSKIPINTRDWDKLVCEIESIAGGGSNCRFNMVACSKVFDTFHDLWKGTYIKYAGSGMTGSAHPPTPLTRYEIDLTKFERDQFYIALETSDCQIKCRRIWLEKGGNS